MVWVRCRGEEWKTSCLRQRVEGRRGRGGGDGAMGWGLQEGGAGGVDWVLCGEEGCRRGCMWVGGGAVIGYVCGLEDLDKVRGEKKRVERRVRRG